jgi:hypothetical protein
MHDCFSCSAYLDIDGWKYWTMGAELDLTTLINRAKLEPSQEHREDRE